MDLFLSLAQGHQHCGLNYHKFKHTTILAPGYMLFTVYPSAVELDPDLNHQEYKHSVMPPRVATESTFPNRTYKEGKI